MLTLYLIALAIGGTLLIASLVLGGGDDMEADVDAGLDVDAGVDLDADADIDVDAGDADVAHADVSHGGGVDISTWLPLVSLRFWTFFAAFFGLTGVALTLAGTGLGSVPIGVASGLVGYVSGLGVMMAFRRMRRSQTSSNILIDDYIGMTATVMIGVGKGKLGKVRLNIRGRTIEAMAVTEEEAPFAVNQQAMIYAVNSDGHVVLTHTGVKQG